MKKLRELWTRFDTSMKGQSLVEMAIITPILIFMLVGVFEVGYVLRNYMILLNASREVARFSTRANYIDWRNNPDYQQAVEHLNGTLAGQLDINRVEMVISFIEIDTGLPCDPEERDDPEPGDAWPNCECTIVATQPYTPYIIHHPGQIDYGHYTYTWPQTATITTRVDYDQLSQRLAKQNDLFNCRAMKKSQAVLPSHNNAVVVELIYEHYQLFGFPIISNPFIDPYPLYVQTTMRDIGSVRGNFGQ